MTAAKSYILRDRKVLANLMADIASLPSEPLMEVVIRLYKRSRSLEQNALLWKWYSAIAADTGHTAEDIHEVCKAKFLPPIFVDIAGEVHEVRRTTTKLKVDEMSSYMSQVQAWAASELGITLPIPEELHMRAA